MWKQIKYHLYILLNRKSTKWGFFIFFSIPLIFYIFFLLGISKITSANGSAFPFFVGFLVLLYFIWRSFLIPVFLVISTNWHKEFINGLHEISFVYFNDRKKFIIGLIISQMIIFCLYFISFTIGFIIYWLLLNKLYSFEIIYPSFNDFLEALPILLIYLSYSFFEIFLTNLFSLKFDTFKSVLYNIFIFVLFSFLGTDKKILFIPFSFFNNVEKFYSDNLFSLNHFIVMIIYSIILVFILIKLLNKKDINSDYIE
ncbi:hypothetical protein [Marinitoga sp. 38H-ov]|uniref:hypothetical protein n=1 Tax=Marinitoga sp. 38H-ov TaxID=1755814 RepID=UPI0013EDC59B|nr:hypothetical protein [Marinitoga sp. 38H-ov]KAF2955452.1 hypothetical protein AS160_10170 [Marinitoga sp. 38H-ov]